MFAAQLEGVDLDAPRAKRHKTAASSPVAIKDEPGPTNGVHDAEASASGAKDNLETVREKGLKLWQTVKDAVDKECVPFYPFDFSSLVTTIRIFHLPTPIYASTTTLTLAFALLAPLSSPLVGLRVAHIPHIQRTRFVFRLPPSPL